MLKGIVNHTLSVCVFVFILTGCNSKPSVMLRRPGASAAEEQVKARGDGLMATYYNFLSSANPFEIEVATRRDLNINFDFGSKSPMENVAATNFGIRWVGKIVPPRTGAYVFCTCAEDGTRLVIDGQRVLRDEAWSNGSIRMWESPPITLEAGKSYPIKLEFYKVGGNGVAKLFWTTLEDQCEIPNDNSQGLQNIPENKSPNSLGELVYSKNCSNGTLMPSLEIVPQTAFEGPDEAYSQKLQSCQFKPTMLKPGEVPLDEWTERAKRLFKRLAGVNVSALDSRVKTVRDLLEKGKSEDAARIVMEDPSFYDITVKNMAARISTREQTVDTPLNDLSATFVGVTRDDIDARYLLTGNFIYRADPILFWYDKGPYSRQATLASNSHYMDIENFKLPLACVLGKIKNPDRPPEYMVQMTALPQSATTPTLMDVLPDTAGVITSRSFAQAHMIAGTNRRAVEKTIEYFLCSKVDTYRDASASDDMVRRDVDRYPGDSNSYVNQYLPECKSCHAQLDGLGGAFAKFHFENDIMKFGPNFIRNNTTADTEAPNNMRQDPLGIAKKMNHNPNYPDGYITRDDRWINHMVGSANAAKFGWGGTLSGNGVRSFGMMVANSRAFPECMAKRVYEEVCRETPSTQTEQWLKEVGVAFARDGFKIKRLFGTIAPRCLE